MYSSRIELYWNINILGLSISAIVSDQSRKLDEYKGLLALLPRIQLQTLKHICLHLKGYDRLTCVLALNIHTLSIVQSRKFNFRDL